MMAAPDSAVVSISSHGINEGLQEAGERRMK